jgi:hypothetical protein
LASHYRPRQQNRPPGCQEELWRWSNPGEKNKITGKPACPSAAIETESGDCTDLLASASSSVLFDAVHREDFQLYLGAGGDVGWLTDYHLTAGIQYKMFFGEIRAGQKQTGIMLGFSSR